MAEQRVPFKCSEQDLLINLVQVNERLGALTTKLDEFTVSVKESLVEMRAENVRRYESVHEEIMAMDHRYRTDLIALEKQYKEDITALETETDKVKEKIAMGAGAVGFLYLLLAVLTYIK